MKRLILLLGIALLTFAIGMYTTAQVNRAAHYIWPDIDPQPQVIADAKPKICPAMMVTPSRDKGKHPQAQISAHSKGH
jgi:hypothetical protein